ncbi:hypothetical protein [Streptomyces virginiae]|uniref:hypothetical protein n=1 Tax=Streptomyces virginiae TaxID=1961 RepID=UPI0037028251
MSDILWYNTESGETQIWLMNKEQRVERATVVDENKKPALIGPPWHIVGAGNVSGVGVDQIVWHNRDTNETQLWRLEDFGITGQRTGRAAVVDENKQPALEGAPWHIVGLGDFNLNGNAGLLWYNTSSGETQTWFMKKLGVGSPFTVQRTGRRTIVDENNKAALIGPPWHIVGVGNFGAGTSGASTDDILWYNTTTGETQIWFMNKERRDGRETVVDENNKAALIGPPWRIVGVGSLDGTGTADILWYDSMTGETQMWFMNKQHRVDRETVVDENRQPALIGPPWHIVGVGSFGAFPPSSPTDPDGPA